MKNSGRMRYRSPRMPMVSGARKPSTIVMWLCRPTRLCSVFAVGVGENKEFEEEFELSLERDVVSRALLVSLWLLLPGFCPKKYILGICSRDHSTLDAVCK